MGGMGGCNDVRVGMRYPVEASSTSPVYRRRGYGEMSVVSQPVVVACCKHRFEAMALERLIIYIPPGT